MPTRLRVSTVLFLLFLLLINPVFFLNLGAGSTVVQAQPAPPIASSPIRLTNTSFDNYFLHSSESVGANGSPNDWKGGKSRATGDVVAWSGLPLNGGPFPGTGTGISYSALNTTSGTLQTVNLPFSAGQGHPSTITTNTPIFADQGAILVSEANQAGAGGTLIYNTKDRTSVDALNPPGASVFLQYGPQPTFSSWGTFAVALTTHPRLTVSSTTYNTTEISAFVGNSWQQVTPNDWSIPTSACGGTSYPTLFDPTTPSQVFARGPGQYVWARFNHAINYTATSSLCRTPVISTTSADIVLESGKVVESFPVNAKSYNGTPCTSNFASTCLGGLIGAWGNIILYSVINVPPNGVCCQYNLWVYDMSTGSKTFIANGGSLYYVDYPNYWSDGKDFVWTGSFGKPATIVVYDPTLGLKRFNQTASFARVGAGWAVWLNNTNYFNFYNIAKQKLWSVNASPGTTTQGISTLSYDFSDGVAAWVTFETVQNPKSSPICSCVVNYVPYLYVVNAPQLDSSAKNLTSVTSKVALTWAKPFPASGGGVRYPLSQDMIVSKGWVFMTGIPIDSKNRQVFAFQPFSGSVGVTEAGKFLPLKEVRVDVIQYNGATATQVATTYTHSAGSFSLLLPGPMSTANPPYVFKVNLTQKDGRFTIMDYSGSRSAFPPYVTNSIVTFQTGDLRAIKVNDNLVILDVAKMVRNAVMGTSASRLAYVENDAYIYYRVHQAYELARDVLNADGIFDRTLQVRTYVPTVTSADFSSTGTMPYIELPPSRVSTSDSSIPNVVWHEFGHAVMWFSPIAGGHAFPPWLAGLNSSGKPDQNHGGYANSDSSDAWVEAWAEYYSSMVAHYVDKRPDAQLYYIFGGGAVSLDDNLKVWAWLEEFSTASALWSISTQWTGNYSFAAGAAQIARPNAANIPIAQVWQGVTAGHVQNTYQLWQAFKSYPGVNQTFVSRDIYIDTNGNGRWDQGEPIGKTSWAVTTTATGIVHATTNPVGLLDSRFVLIYPKMNRPEAPTAPGSGVLVNLSDTETGAPVQGVTAHVSVAGPTGQLYAYSIALPPGADSFYLFLPAGLNETATVTVGAQGYSNTRIFSVTGDAVQSSVFANLYQNSTNQYVMKLNSTLTRDHTIQTDFPFTANSGSAQYSVDITSDSTITSQGYNQAASAITFQSYTPTGRTGTVNVTLPWAMDNGTFTLTVNGARVGFTQKQNSISNALSFAVPAGKASVSIWLAPVASGGAQTTAAASATSSSTVVGASSQSSPSSASSANTPEGGGTSSSSNYGLVAVVGVAIVIVAAAGYLIVKRRK